MGPSPPPPPPQSYVPIQVLAELQRLPAARVFPPGHLKRCRGGARRAAAAPHGAQHKASAHAALDPTGYLLLEAASHLSDLIREQQERRLLRHADGGASSGESSDEDEPCVHPRRLLLAEAEPSGRSGSVGAAASASVASASAGNRGGGSGSLPDSGHSSLGVKRVRMQRAYAIDLAGQCRLGQERLPLPAPPEGPA